MTVPSSVSGVTVNNSGRNDYLSISWLPAPGDVDNYVVTLSHDSKVVQSLVIAKSVSECSFSFFYPLCLAVGFWVDLHLTSQDLC